MSLSEKVQQLNSEIGSAMEHALDQVRQEVSQWLRSSNEEILGRLAQLRADIPESFVAHDDLSPAVHSAAEELSGKAREEAQQQARQEIEQARREAEKARQETEQARRETEQARQEASRQARRGGAAELCASLSSIDRARSQAEILNALLQEAGRHAPRAAILLLRGGEVRSWAGTGFGDADAALRQVSLGIPGEGSWSHVFQGQGPSYLSASDCALLCSRIEAPLAHGGVLVPMILRDRVAAAIYADRLDGEPIAAEALQVLAYTAALAIESLPFRERTATATLAALAGTPPAAPVAEPEPADEEPTAVELPPPAEPEPATMAYEEPAPEPALEETPADTLRSEALPSAGGWESPAGGAETFTETEVEVEAEPEPASTSWTPVEAIEPVAPVEDATAPYPVEAMAVEEASEPAAWGQPVRVEEDSGIPTQQVDLRSLQGQGSQEPPPASPDATVLLQRPNLREVPPPPPEPELPPPTPIRPAQPVPPADDTAPSLPGTPEVRPPSDLQGPGWAFASARVPITPSDEALHEEARRLARLLVSEIKLYNEEQVEEGRRKRDVYERLREDIDRSRQMYEERVEPRILKTTDYFYQELVRILAAGDARALGI
jgi:hypothetical protein